MSPLLQIVSLCLTLCACAQTQKTESHAPILELSMARPNGQRVELAMLTGRPRLLFLFATYDQPSQFAIVPVTRLAESEPRVQVIGVALQPDAKTFIGLFKEALSVPFEIFYDPDNQVLRKQTALGALRGVPALVVLDADGHIRAVHYGPLEYSALQTLVRESLD